MSFYFEIPGSSSPKVIELPLGGSTIFVGANGSGKTRLAALCETSFGASAHRISAHRSLALNPGVPKIGERLAKEMLRFGTENPVQSYGSESNSRNIRRWNQQAATALLADFDLLLQVLFAEQANTALRTHDEAHAGTLKTPKLTHFQNLKMIWERVLPGRSLQVTGDDIQVVSSVGQSVYSASEMSDGERAVFYLVGQILVAAPSSILIFDEPELHVHRAILSRLWDEVEAARPDCAFLLITHDLEFAASRPGQKFVILEYMPSVGWEIESIPDETGFSEETTTLILGSRTPILFVEGEGESLDLAIYRACYPDWTVLPRGSCTNVIHSVVTMRRNAALTRVTCAGIVDADDYDEDDKRQLSALGLATLPVSEIENLILLPSVSTAILKDEKFTGTALQDRLDALKGAVFDEASKADVIMDIVMRHCRRRIDRTLKKIDLSDATSPEALSKAYADRTAAFDISDLATATKQRIESAISSEDLIGLLAIFDRKSRLMSLAAAHLKNNKLDAFQSWITRAMRAGGESNIPAALKEVLPVITPL